MKRKEFIFMKWKKFTLKTLSEVEDIVISTLAEADVKKIRFPGDFFSRKTDKVIFRGKFSALWLW